MRLSTQQHAIERGSETAGLCGLAAAGLVDRRSQRDELFLDAADVAVVIAGQRVHRRAAEPEVRGERLGIDRLARSVAASSSSRTARSDRPRRPPGSGARTRSRIVGTQIDVLHRRRDAAAGAFAIRLLDDQRNAQRGIVERHARARFAVIADEQNRRLVVEPPLLQRRREPGDRGVRIAAVDLHEEEEALAAAHLNPALGGIDRQRALAFERGHFVCRSARGISASKNENPCDSPDCGRSRNDDTAAPVVKPRLRSSSASVRALGRRA